MWPNVPRTPERRDPDGHQVRLGYILRRHGFERHSGIVTRVCLARGGGRGEGAQVVSASRDGTLKCWDVPAPAETIGGSSSSTSGPQLRCSLEEHTGWVNDCVTLPAAPSTAQTRQDVFRLVSASNDNLVKVWLVDEEAQSAGVVSASLSLRYHVDHVTCLSYAQRHGLLASAGLDSRVIVSDLEAATRVLTLNANDGSESNGSNMAHYWPSFGMGGSAALGCLVGQFTGSGQYVPQLLLHHAQKAVSRDKTQGVEQENSTKSAGSSVWALGMTSTASLIACGTASCIIRGWDPRSGLRIWRFRGHTENVRALALSDDGTICVSGSADRTVRIWDVGMRQCVHVFEGHHDSVWALASASSSCGYCQGNDGSIDEVLSAGRDGLILAHDLRRLESYYVALEPSAVPAFAVSSDASQIWVADSESNIRRHEMPPIRAVYSGNSAQSISDAIRPPGSTPFLPAPALPPSGTDTIAIRGNPRLTDYRVLDTKRQVLVRDAYGQFSLWDVTTGQCVDLPAPTPPKTDADQQGAPGSEELMNMVFEHVNRPVSVPSWFSCDLSNGSLTVTLDAAQCFKAESDQADVALSMPIGSSHRGPSRVVEETSSGVVNLGARTLRALFSSWIRLPPSPVRHDRSAATSRTNSISQTRRSGCGRPRFFIAPPALPAPGPPVDQSQSGAVGSWEATCGGSSSSTFPPATALVLVSRSGRPVGFRGRLYCGLFSSSETPELLPQWIVDVVWNHRPPPEELCGEKSLCFTVLRCSSEMALPLLSTALAVAAPRTRVRRLMFFLVRSLDYDWNHSGNKAPQRRPASARSFVSRLGRCCVAPGGNRQRSSSSESWNHSDKSDSSGFARGCSNTSGARGGNRRCSGKKNRGVGKEYPTFAGSSSSSGRRGFGLKTRHDDEAPESVGLVGRMRIDSNPSPVPSVTAVSSGISLNSRGCGTSVCTNGEIPMAPPDEHCIEILCNDTVVNPDMSLATIRDFFWKKPSKEMVLTYRRAVRPAPYITPAPFPAPPYPAGNDASFDVHEYELNGRGHEVAGTLPSTDGAQSPLSASKE